MNEYFASYYTEAGEVKTVIVEADDVLEVYNSVRNEIDFYQIDYIELL